MRSTEIRNGLKFEREIGKISNYLPTEGSNVVETEMYEEGKKSRDWHESNEFFNTWKRLNIFIAAWQNLKNLCTCATIIMNALNRNSTAWTKFIANNDAAYVIWIPTQPLTKSNLSINLSINYTTSNNKQLIN